MKNFCKKSWDFSQFDIYELPVHLRWMMAALLGLLNYTSFDPEELVGSGPSPAQIERYLGGRGGGKRHTIAGAPQPDSPRRRRTGLMTVMEKPPNIPPDLIQVCWLLILSPCLWEGYWLLQLPFRYLIYLVVFYRVVREALFWLTVTYMIESAFLCLHVQ